MLYIRKDILGLLKEKGYNTTRLRKEHILSERTLTCIRKGASIHLSTLDRLCNLTDRDPEDLLVYHKERD